MGMFASSKFYEDGFHSLTSNVNCILINTSQCATRASAASSNNLLAWATAAASSDFVISSNTSGYIVTISSNADLISATTLESTGVASHIALCSTVDLYYITTCTTKALGSGDTVTMPSWTIWIKQPTS